MTDVEPSASSDVTPAMDRRVPASDGGTDVPPLVARPSALHNHAPLSYAQQSFWFLQQLQPKAPFSNIAVAVRLSGKLAIGTLELALNEIERRHSVLRTVFEEQRGAIVQTIRPVRERRLERLDLTSHSEPLRSAELSRHMSDRASRPFDLTRGPLFESLLYRVGPEEHVLLVTTHHIVFDGSSPLFWHELGVLYSAYCREEPSPLPEPQLQFADFAAWERQWLQGDALAAQVAYWTRTLSGAPPRLDLLPDRPRGRVQQFRGATMRFQLPNALALDLRRLCRSENTTLFPIVLASHAVLMSRCTGEQEFVVGTPVTRHSAPQTERVIGCWTNTLPIRIGLTGNPTVRELLARAREALLEGMAYLDAPFDKIVASLKGPRDLSRNPLFQTMLVVHGHAPDAELKLPGLRATTLAVSTSSSRFDLSLGLSDSGRKITGVAEYDSDLFDASTIERLLTHFRQVLEHVVGDPGRRISEIELAGEREQVVVEWNATRRQYAARCVHELVEGQVARAPEAMAVVGAGVGAEGLTYGELDRRANRVAHQLRALGVGRGGYVGVYLGRSPAMVVALLGVLKAGAAYVPLDVAYPVARVQWILGALGVQCLLTEAAGLRVVGELAAASGLRDVICLDEVPEGTDRAGEEHGGGPRVHPLAELNSHPATRPDAGAAPDDLAYVIFTSGSTGAPKGVMVTHRPVANLIDWVNRTFAVGPADRGLFVTSLCFDLSVYDVFGLLAAGGTIRVASDSEVRQPERLLEILDQEPITFWDSAPAALEQLLPFFGASRTGGGSALRLAFLSGDWIPVGLPDQLRARFPGAAVVALCVETEATVWSNYYRVGTVDANWPSIPYGRPIQNARYFVLNQHGRPAPIGVPGELYIGGGVLAAGYAGAPGLTAERFVPDPFGEEPGARLYRTGDRVRWRADGELEFLGRLDHQVKLRGYRIELGEVEAALARQPGVRQCVVAMREDVPGERRLVAYVAGASAGVSELRQALGRVLPDYMVPQAVVLLPALPLTANGKVDRRALPAPEGGRPELSVPYVAPRTPAEQVLAGIWAGVLGLDRVGIHDNFFDLGGDSILSILVVTRAADAALQLTPAHVFEFQTIAELAPVIRARPSGARDDPTGDAVPLTPIQNWFFGWRLPVYNQFNQSVLLRIKRPLRVETLTAAISALAKHHDALRLRFAPTESGWQQSYSRSDNHVGVEAVDLTRLPANAQTTVFDEMAALAHASLEISRGPIARALIFDFGPVQLPQLLIVAHHLVVDFISWQILVSDLGTAYDQLEHNVPIALGGHSSSFQRWATELVNHSQSQDVMNDLAYWTDSSWHRARPLPVDVGVQSDENTVAAMRTIRTSLKPSDTRHLLQARGFYRDTRIDDLIVTALSPVLASWMGSGEVLVTLEGHGRDAFLGQLDVTRTVGWFTALYPARLLLCAGELTLDAIDLIQRRLRGAPHNGVTYGMLQYCRADGRSRALLQSLPRTQLSFTYFGQLDQLYSPTPVFR